MLERYLAGSNIEGMLRHNVFMAEKCSSRVYLPQAIIKYDEAVRDKARDIGTVAYTGGDMSLAMRFLSTEFTKPKPVGYNNTYGQKSGKKQAGSQAYAAVNGRPTRQVFGSLIQVAALLKRAGTHISVVDVSSLGTYNILVKLALATFIMQTNLSHRTGRVESRVLKFMHVQSIMTRSLMFMTVFQKCVLLAPHRRVQVQRYTLYRWYVRLQ